MPLAPSKFIHASPKPQMRKAMQGASRPLSTSRGALRGPSSKRRFLFAARKEDPMGGWLAGMRVGLQRCKVRRGNGAYTFRPLLFLRPAKLWPTILHPTMIPEAAVHSSGLADDLALRLHRSYGLAGPALSAAVHATESAPSNSGAPTCAAGPERIGRAGEALNAAVM